MDIKDIKGIGPKTIEKLKEKGITDLKSLLFTFPKSYDINVISGFSYFDEFIVEGVISDSLYLKKKGKTNFLTFKILIEGIEYKVSAFNMAYLYKTLKLNDTIILKGKWDKEYKTIVLEKLFKKDTFKEGIVPDYGIDGITNSIITKLMMEAIKEYEDKSSLIPVNVYQKHGYKIGRELLTMIHFPKKIEDVDTAKDCLKYHELLSFSIKLELVRERQMSLRKTPKVIDKEKVRELTAKIPFELTLDQKKAVNDIYHIMSSDIPLNMLLEGDVGSGKTIVSLITSYACFTSGMQILLMAPTESLANQHYNTYRKYLDDLGVKTALLTSSISAKERKMILEGLKDNSINIVIGTHSLINDEVIFNNLGYVICDEQHKFGVEQRKKIKDKGNNPDVLYMTATPIPRTLALTLFNDMQLETIKSVPSSRKKTKTYCHTYKDYIKILDFVKSEIDSGRQAYFVAPKIENETDSEIQSVSRIKEDLEKYFNGSVSIGLLHGKMDAIEKKECLDKFIRKEYDIIVSTTVIEVGIDNPNASVMVIIDATNFGLSTLHQLRGRVGRGEYQGYCFLLSGKRDLLERIRILEETNDGFEISEYDLRERGAGDFLGKEQTGMLKFEYANIFRDKKLLDMARMDAKELINIENVREHYTKQLFSKNFD